jgi:protein-S-isoprenylcysteine O-methyltransferase Ste14
LNAEMLLRASLACIMLLSLGLTLYFRRRAASLGGAVSRVHEGLLMLVALRLCGMLLGAATLAYLISPARVKWAEVAVPLAARLLAVGLGFLSVLLMAWTLRCLGGNLTDTVVTRSEATLVTEGPYRWVRHPFYFVAGLLMLSATLISANWLIGLASLAVMGLLAMRTPREESMLASRFGQEYADYKRRTPAFFPLGFWRGDGAKR